MKHKDAVRLGTVAASLVIAAAGVSHEAAAGHKSTPHVASTSSPHGPSSFNKENSGHVQGGGSSGGVITNATGTAVNETISNGGIVTLGSPGFGIQIGPIQTFYGGIVNSGTIAPPIAP
jgi:hypothetical protein